MDKITIPKNSYHLSLEKGWLNDPNGFIYYKGKYHCFFQYSPNGTELGLKSWGHAVSIDLIKWKLLPVALSPDKDYDVGGCWSGGAIEKDGILYLVYTGVSYENNKQVQTQCIAYSNDGVNFVKYSGNPVISDKNMPFGASRKDCRDPFIWFYGGWYYLLVGSIDGEVLKGIPQLLMFRSKDLLKFEFVSTPIKGYDFSIFCECPNYVKTKNSDLLFVSVPCKQPKKHRFNNLATTLYCVGKMDYNRGQFNIKHFDEVDFGTDFYATQTTISPEYNKPLILAWMNMWNREFPTLSNDGWAGTICLPREIFVKRNRLYMKPIKAIYKYLKNTIGFDAEFHGEKKFCNVSGTYIHIQLKIELYDNDTRLDIKFFSNKEYYTLFSINKNSIIFDRSHSQFQPLGCNDETSNTGIRKALLNKRNNIIDAEFFLDGCTIEGFFENGKLCMSANTFNTYDKKGIVFFAEGKVKIYGKKSDIIV